MEISKEETIEPEELWKNKMQCLLCGKTIESEHRHDFVRCTCNNVSIDGGNDYWKVSFKTKAFKRIWEKMGD